MVQPNRTQMSRMLDRPNTWNSGRTAITMSSGRTSNRRPGDVGVHVELQVGELGALGAPVVPEV